MTVKFYILSISAAVILLPALSPAQGLIIPANGYVIANSGNIITYSNWVNNGSFTHNGGTVIFAGTTQALGGTAAETFNNLTIASGSTTITSSGQFVKGILLCNSTLNANGGLTLLSNASQTALIDGSGTGEVLGNVTMQRYLPSGFGYKYFSSPFTAATVNEFADDINLADSFPTFYRYDENLVSSGWVTDTTASNVLAPLRGYAANFGSSSSPVTVDITGVVNNHTVTLSPLYNHNKTYTLGFNLAGNPYPSPIDWDIAGGWSKSNIDNAIYYFNAGNRDRYTGTYSSYINGVSSDGVANNLIPAMQGFFVHVSDGTYPVSGSLSVNNNARTTGPSVTFHFAPPGSDIPLLRLTAGYSNELHSDPFVTYFDAGATAGFDKTLDALKLMNTNEKVPNLYSLAADTRFSINAIPEPGSTSIVPLGLKTTKDASLTFSMASIKNIPASLYIYLKDAQTQTIQDLRSDENYTVYLVAGKYEGRFSIIFSRKNLLGQPLPDTIPNTVNDKFNIYGSGKKVFLQFSLVNDKKGSLVVYNMLGKQVLKQDVNSTGRYEYDLPVASGIYIARLYVDKQAFITKKIFIGN